LARRAIFPAIRDCSPKCRKRKRLLSGRPGSVKIVEHVADFWRSFSNAFSASSTHALEEWYVTLLARRPCGSLAAEPHGSPHTGAAPMRRRQSTPKLAAAEPADRWRQNGKTRREGRATDTLSFAAQAPTGGAHALPTCPMRLVTWLALLAVAHSIFAARQSQMCRVSHAGRSLCALRSGLQLPAQLQSAYLVRATHRIVLIEIQGACVCVCVGVLCVYVCHHCVCVCVCVCLRRV
jgi:hypothetical protein